ncbi:glutamate receptor 2.3-like [Salvia miltiorrhiza]|uniref:glutamate receptor 2.3-like n=1 Tax=Salvia miltiorrhiza TaxID=226208 RepID=UPI0025AB8C8E|nr:glutamate receptor 2.3-like [Salvia miltiorrhiza]
MSFCVVRLNCRNATSTEVDIGVILDLDTPLGKMCITCISMAIEDFYSNRNHSTVIVPRFRDSMSDVVAAAFTGQGIWRWRNYSHDEEGIGLKIEDEPLCLK